MNADGYFGGPSTMRLTGYGEDKPRNMQWIEDPDHRFKTAEVCEFSSHRRKLVGTEISGPTPITSLF